MFAYGVAFFMIKPKAKFLNILPNDFFSRVSTCFAKGIAAINKYSVFGLQRYGIRNQFKCGAKAFVSATQCFNRLVAFADIGKYQNHTNNIFVCIAYWCGAV